MPEGHNVLEQMGGKIWVESQPHHGSVFSFTARFKQANKERDHAAIPTVNLRGKRALVVDDNAMAQAVLSSYLAGMFLRVDSVSSGKEALEMMERACQQQDAFDVLCIDWKMPGLNGMETLKILRQHAGITPPSACIMVSAYGQEELQDSLVRDYIDSFLTKPITPSQLLDSLQRALVGDRAGQGTIGQKTIYTPDPTRFRGARILVVDDNEINLQIAQELLQEANIRVELVANGALAVDRVIANSETPYDAILMDIQMPVMDGHAATRAILARYPSLITPIIAMTANAMQQDIDVCMELGMVDCVTKPIDVAKLFDTLERRIPRQEWAKPSEAELVQAPEPAIGATGAVLPMLMAVRSGQFPGLDVAAAMGRTNNNGELYVRLLKLFKGKTHDTAPRLNTLLQSRAFPEAAQLVHSVKGIAGNLGAVELYQAAIGLESVLKAEKDPSVAVAVFHAALETTMVSLDALLAWLEQAEVQLAAPSQEVALCVDWQKMQELRALLASKNLRAGTLLASIGPGMRAEGLSTEADLLEALIGRLCYDEAVTIIDRIVEGVA